MTTERRRAPRRKINEIERVGRWGKVEYHHHLSCGHIESRKRASSTDEIACAWCLRAEEKDKEIKSLTAPKPQSIIYENMDSRIAAEELKIEKAKSILSARLRIPLEAVDVVAGEFNGELFIRSATIYLSASDVSRLTSDS